MEVRELELSEQELSGSAYEIQTPEKGRHDLIEVPAEEMQRLKSRVAQTVYLGHVRSGEVWGGDTLGKREMGRGERFCTAPLETQLGAEGVLDPSTTLRGGQWHPALPCALYLSPCSAPAGFHRVTVKNMWFGYGSLQRCLSSSGTSAVSQGTAAPDGGQK
ncbi:hypothetical protein DV515_00013305 [Chloebia gouldiae]|uniref:Uncharacterized protein n=1 Tax=Chloebia gouldiae TaxID=44316 RepID=A0A3L8S2J1_CHLGU|nr:hypothetical protein DV515_00013305 [Chloebia gouldiae]